MRAQQIKYAVNWLTVAACIVAALSMLAGVPYSYSVCGISAWVAFGHFVTVDDDAPGGWSNQDNSKSIWRRSLAKLLIKFAVFVGLITIVFAFATRKQIDASIDGFVSLVAR